MTRRRALLFAATMLSILVADQVTKALVRASFGIAESVPLIDGVVRLTHVHNTGAAFGMFRGQQWLLISIAIAVLAAIAYAVVRIRPESAMARTALAMVAAGTLGNLIDRVVAGGVTDFIDFGWFPVFNVADISLDVGVVLLVFWLLFRHEHRQPRVVADVAGAVDRPAETIAETRFGDE